MASPVENYFARHAVSYDRRYDREPLLRLVRPGVVRARDRAVRLVRCRTAARVLDVGCGPGRVAENLLEAGAAEYVGVDLAEPMLELARRRLARFGPRATLMRADFGEARLGGTFDVVIALGLFDYVDEPESYLRRMRNLCSGVLLATFPARRLRDPVRQLVYRAHGCSVRTYREEDVRGLVAAAGLEDAEIVRGAGGHRVEARGSARARS